MTDLGDVIRQRSRALGLTQQALADRAGVHVRQIRRYENGEQQPALNVAVRLAATLGVSLDELAGVSAAITVDGDWWAARQLLLDGKPVTVAVPVRLTRHGSTVELEAFEGAGAWRGELRLWSGPTLTGWYAGAGTHGTLLLALRDEVAEGRWTGVAADGAILTGHAALARTRDAAQRTIAVLST